MVTCIKNIATINSRFRGVTDSTNDFGSFSQGSNPCGTARKQLILIILTVESFLQNIF